MQHGVVSGAARRDGYVGYNTERWVRTGVQSFFRFRFSSTTVRVLKVEHFIFRRLSLDQIFPKTPPLFGIGNLDLPLVLEKIER